MEIYLIVGAIILIAFLVPKGKKDNQKAAQNKHKTQPLENSKKDEIDITEVEISEQPEENALNISGAYQKRWMFSMNEKDAYRKLKTIADELGYIVFAKVRLLDLLQPKKGIEKYKTYFYKIQAKHVDFVLCDQKLVARYIIELDDNSHDTQARKERDEFVDKVVQSVGYKIIHTRAITDDIKKQIMPL